MHSNQGVGSRHRHTSTKPLHASPRPVTYRYLVIPGAISLIWMLPIVVLQHNFDWMSISNTDAKGRHTLLFPPPPPYSFHTLLVRAAFLAAVSCAAGREFIHLWYDSLGRMSVMEVIAWLDL